MLSLNDATGKIEKIEEEPLTIPYKNESA